MRSDVSESGRGDDPLLGRVIEGRYRIDDVLGAGGVGVVYRAEQTFLNRPVAIKVLNEEFGGVPELLKRFEREAKALSSLAHPHIVQLNDYGSTNGMPYLVMELLEGRTLADLIDDPSGPPEPELALDIGRQILRGLSFAHARGVLHRDLKPGNVFLQRLPDDPYHVKILDFGLAKIFSSEDGSTVGEPTLTRMGTILGTPAYMSPEQASGGRVDVRTDVYSFGVMLFEMLTGRYPFMSETRHEMLRAHMIEPVPQASECREGLVVSKELQGLIERAMAKERADRFADASDVLDALDALPKPAATLRRVSRPKGERQVNSTESTIQVPPDEDDEDDEELESAPSSHALSSRKRPIPVERTEGDRRSMRGVAAFFLFVVMMAAGGYAAWRFLPGRVPGMSSGSTPEQASDDPPRPDEPDEPPPEPPPENAVGTQPPEPPVEPPTEVVPTEPVQVDEQVANVPARDPFRDPMPRELRPFHQKVRRGQALSSREAREVLALQRELRDDPRPTLVLAHEAVDERHFSDALEYYRTAVTIDPSARGDGRMLPDLVRLARTPSVGARASDMIFRLYGTGALPQIERELGEADIPDEERGRLDALRSALAPGE